MKQSQKQKERIEAIVSRLPELAMMFHNLFRAGSSSTREHKTNLIRYNILKCLERNGTQHLTDVSCNVHYKKNTLSELLDRMVGAGLVGRETHAEDRRKMHFTIKAEGEKAMREYEKKFTGNMEGFLRTLAKEERECLLDGLGMLMRVSVVWAGAMTDSGPAKRQAR